MSAFGQLMEQLVRLDWVESRGTKCRENDRFLDDLTSTFAVDGLGLVRTSLPQQKLPDRPVYYGSQPEDLGTPRAPEGLRVEPIARHHCLNGFR